MTFGYNAAAAFANSVAGIRDHARGLLNALVEQRARSFVSEVECSSFLSCFTNSGYFLEKCGVVPKCRMNRY